MKNKAIYPGTFDPITYGHIDVIKKALKIVDKLIVAVSDGNTKNYLFDINERIEIVKKALFVDAKLNKKKINVISFKTLTTSLCKKLNSNIYYIDMSSCVLNLGGSALMQSNNKIGNKSNAKIKISILGNFS